MHEQFSLDKPPAVKLGEGNNIVIESIEAQYVEMVYCFGTRHLSGMPGNLEPKRPDDIRVYLTSVESGTKFGKKPNGQPIIIGWAPPKKDRQFKEVVKKINGDSKIEEFVEGFIPFPVQDNPTAIVILLKKNISPEIVLGLLPKGTLPIADQRGEVESSIPHLQDTGLITKTEEESKHTQSVEFEKSTELLPQVSTENAQGGENPLSQDSELTIGAPTVHSTDTNNGPSTTQNQPDGSEEQLPEARIQPVEEQSTDVESKVTTPEPINLAQVLEEAKQAYLQRNYDDALLKIDKVEENSNPDSNEAKLASELKVHITHKDQLEKLLLIGTAEDTLRSIDQCISSGLSYDLNFKPLTELQRNLVNTLQKEQALQQARELQKEKRFVEALGALDQRTEQEGDTPEVRALHAELAKLAEDFNQIHTLKSQAGSLILSNQFEQALLALTQAQALARELELNDQAEEIQNEIGTTQVKLQQYKLHVALQIGGQYFVLRISNTTGTTAVVWQARLLRGEPKWGEFFEILDPNPSTWARLIDEALSGRQYIDDEAGELVAIKIAKPGKESALEKEIGALRRLGSRVLRLYYPTAAQGFAFEKEFPCMVSEWVNGNKLSERNQPFSEPDGLLIISQLTELLYTARLSAPDIVPTDGIKADAIFIDEKNNFRTRLIDWNVFVTEEGNVRERTLIRIGEVMVSVFAPGLGFRIERNTNEVDIDRLGAGRPDTAGASQWDALSLGTRNLIRRVLLKQFEGNADAIIAALQQAIKEQQARWLTLEPLQRAHQESGAARLNLLDIARAKAPNQALTEDEENNYQLLLREYIDDYGRDSSYKSALLELRTAVRRFPQESFFRWALLANTIADACQETRALIRLRLDESLDQLRNARYEQAQAALEWARSFVDSGQVQFKPGKQPDAQKRLLALLGRSQILAITERANAVQDVEDWRLDELEAYYSQAIDLDTRCSTIEQEKDLLFGSDLQIAERMGKLRDKISQMAERRSVYIAEAGQSQRQALERVRELNFQRIIQRANQLSILGTSEEKPDLLVASLKYYDQASAEYPDYWSKPKPNSDETAESFEAKRQAVSIWLAEYYQNRAQGLLGETWQPEQALRALDQALIYNRENIQVIKLRNALQIYQEGEIALSLEDYQTAQDEFRQAAKLDNILIDPVKPILKLLEPTIALSVAFRHLKDATDLVKITHALQELENAIQIAEALEKTLIDLTSSGKDHFTTALAQARTAESEAENRIPAMLNTWLEDSPDQASIAAIRNQLPSRYSMAQATLASIELYLKTKACLQKEPPDLEEAGKAWVQAEEERQKLDSTELARSVGNYRQQALELLNGQKQRIWEAVYHDVVVERQPLLETLENANRKLANLAIPIAPAGTDNIADLSYSLELLAEQYSRDSSRKFTDTLANSDPDRISDVVLEVHTIKEKVQEYFKSLTYKPFQMFVGGSDPNQILRDALNSVWQDLYQHLSKPEPMHSALVTRQVIQQNSESLQALAFATISLIQPNQRSYLLTTSGWVPKEPIFSERGEQRFIYELGNLVPEERDLRAACEKLTKGDRSPVPPAPRRAFSWIGLLAGAGIGLILALGLIILLAKLNPAAINAFLNPTESSVVVMGDQTATYTPTQTSSNTPTASPSSTSTETPTMTPSYTPTITLTPTLQNCTYTVMDNDGFLRIATFYSTTVEKLKELNPEIINLQPGQTLNVPCPTPLQPSDTPTPTSAEVGEPTAPVETPTTTSAMLAGLIEIKSANPISATLTCNSGDCVLTLPSIYTETIVANVNLPNTSSETRLIVNSIEGSSNNIPNGDLNGEVKFTPQTFETKSFVCDDLTSPAECTMVEDPPDGFVFAFTNSADQQTYTLPITQILGKVPIISNNVKFSCENLDNPKTNSYPCELEISDLQDTQKYGLLFTPFTSSGILKKSGDYSISFDPPALNKLLDENGFIELSELKPGEPYPITLKIACGKKDNTKYICQPSNVYVQVFAKDEKDRLRPLSSYGLQPVYILIKKAPNNPQ